MTATNLGVFTTIMLTEGKLLYFEKHCARLMKHCTALGLNPKAILLTDIQNLICEKQAFQGIWRLRIMITYDNLSPQIVLEPYSTSKIESYCLKSYLEGINDPYPTLKTTFKMDRHFLLDYAAKYFCDDVVIINCTGYVTECAFANLFWKCGRHIFTPSPTLPLMYGITLTIVKEMAHHMQFTWHEVCAKITDIPVEAQIYLCNSLKGVVPVIKIDHQIYQRDRDFENQITALIANKV